MKKILIAFTMVIAAATLVAQATVGEPQPEKIGVDSAQQKLKEVSVNKFEDAGFWNSTMSADDGITQTRQFKGGPAGKNDEQIAEERYIGLDPQVADQYVVGTRVDFYRRGYQDIVIYPNRPIPIEGIAKTISVWVVGRNYNHVLKVQVRDFFGNDFELTMGKLNFQGWKKMTVAVPPQGVDGFSGIVQRNFHYRSKMGLRITGFKIECDPMEAYGSYYIYFDDLRAVSDLFSEDNRDPDDLPDTW